jgi:hypothetical protein
MTLFAYAVKAKVKDLHLYKGILEQVWHFKSKKSHYANSAWFDMPYQLAHTLRLSIYM